LYVPMIFNPSEIAPEVILSRSWVCPLKEQTVAVMPKEGMPDFEHVKKWAAQGHLTGKEGK